MARLKVGLIAALGALLAAGPAGAGEAEVYRCELGNLERKVEVRSPAGAKLPCQVVYLKPTEEPGVTQVLWRADNEPQYCREQARGLIAGLSSNGWQCAALDQAQPIRTPAPSPVEAERSPVLDRALDEAVRQDLALLAGSTDRGIDVEIGSYGDLDGDGNADAAVLFTFDPEGPNHAQYLVVYLGDGEAFQPVASRFVGGRYRDVFRGQVERIENGQIMLALQILRDGDPYCCPSGSGVAHYMLRDGQLVSVE
jgi:hypothetical protein